MKEIFNANLKAGRYRQAKKNTKYANRKGFKYNCEKCRAEV